MAAKTLTGNPLVIEAADTFATVPASQALVRIRSIYWDTGSAPAAGNSVLVAHANGTPIWFTVLEATDLGDQQIDNCHIEAKGLAITPPTSGVLFVYLMDSYA